MSKKISALQPISKVELPSAFLVAAVGSEGNEDNKKVKVEDNLATLEKFNSLKSKVESLEKIIITLDDSLGDMGDLLSSLVDIKDAGRVMISTDNGNSITTSDSISSLELNCLDGVKSNIQEQLDSLTSQAAILGGGVGSVTYFAGSSVPAGYLLCDGRSVSRSTYSKLFEIIGTTWGSENTTTFKLPNLINKVIWGGNTSDVGTYKEAGLPNITGQFDGVQSFAWHNADGVFAGSGAKGQGANRGNDGCGSNKITFNASKSNSIYGKSTTVQPPAAVLLPIIKY